MSWAARAKGAISQTGHPCTDKTDERGVLSVLAVPTHGFSEIHEEVLSVSSVRTQGFYKKHVFLSDLIEAAMKACDHWKDGPEAREQMRLDCESTPEHLRAELLDHFRSAYGSKA